MRVQLPILVGKSVDAIIVDAFRSLGCAPMGGPSSNGWSKQGDFQRCPRRYQLIHEVGAVPTVAGDGSEALDVGSVGHALLAVYYAKMLPDDRYPGWREKVPEPEALLKAMVDQGLPIQIASVVERCFEGYIEFWGNEDVRPLAVEMQAGDAKFHTSRFDLVFFTEDGIHDGLWVQEHKFLKAGTDLEEYKLHGEILGEVLSFHLSKLDDFFGMPLNGVCLNVIFKPTAKMLPKYQRLWIQPTWDALERYAADRKYWIQAMLECKRMKTWPRALSGCKRYKLCRYFAHCRDLDDAQLKLKE